jgi:hypothetical protein
MKYYERFSTLIAACFLCLVVFPLPAYAYIDPNAAGLISQILTPLLIAAAACLTFLRKRVGAALTGLAKHLGRRSDGESV